MPELPRARSGCELWIPAVEAADHRNLARIRRPDAEGCARFAALRGEVRSQLFVDAVVAAFVEEIEILIGEQAGF